MVLSLAPWFDGHVSPRLITTAVLDLLYPRVPLLPGPPGVVSDPWKLWTGPPPDFSFAHPRVGFTLGITDELHGRRAGFDVNTTDEFLLIGHSLFGLLVAVCGGRLARYFNEDSASSES
jgi:hypothetical protein